MKTLTDNQKAICVLDQARELIREPKRWIKGAYYHDGRHCALGALDKAAAFDDHLEGLANDALQHVVDVLSDGQWSIPCFNDDPCTTHADVMAAFDLAIETLRGEP